jgi:hypothetical protein
VCCERALKSAGELLSTRGLAGAGAFGEPPARGTAGVTGLAVSGDLAAGVSPAGKLLTARWASGFAAPSSQLGLPARCAHAVLADHDLNVIYYIALASDCPLGARPALRGPQHRVRTRTSPPAGAGRTAEDREKQSTAACPWDGRREWEWAARGLRGSGGGDLFPLTADSESSHRVVYTNRLRSPTDMVSFSRWIRTNCPVLSS